MSERGTIRTLLRVAGLGMIAVAVVWFVGGTTHLLSMEAAAFGGHSALRGIASIAVVGCLLAAIGFWEH